MMAVIFFVNITFNTIYTSSLFLMTRTYEGKAIVGNLSVMTILYFLLLVVPGIIKAYEYRFVSYLTADHPEMSGTEVITLSRQMMRGHKWRAFVLDLSFLGWYILSAFTFFLLSIFYVNPYKHSTDAELYKALKNEF